MLNVYTKNLEDAAVLFVQGHIVNGETETLRNAVNNTSDKRNVILDLSRVTTVDAHGLGVMLQLRENTEAKGKHLQLMNPSKPLSKVLELTRLDKVFDIGSGVEIFPSIRNKQEQDRVLLKSCA
jgi:anti-anti-sigma factor